MKCTERLDEYKDDDLDHIILLVRNGTIKSGRYSHLVKVDKSKEMKGKVLFKDGKDNYSRES